jgi:hypothetical protein
MNVFAHAVDAVTTHAERAAAAVDEARARSSRSRFGVPRT